MKLGFGSLYLRLLALFGASFLLLFAVLGAVVSSGFAYGKDQLLQKNLQHYADLLAKELGSPVDADKADILSQTLGIDLYWDAPRGSGSTAPERPRHAQREIRAVNGDTTLYFVPRGPVLAPHWEGLAWALPAAAAILLASWGVLRLLLRPLEQMTALALSLGLTDWKTRIPVKGRGELSDLARTFNTMADRIEDYWRSQRELLVAVSHELRSPLTRMRVALEFVADEAIRGSLTEEVLRLDRMTGILLERERLAQRPDLLQRELVTLPGWLEEAASPYRKAGLDVRLSGPALSVSLDADRVALALSNLLENIQRHAPGSPATVAWSAQNGDWVLAVSDEGPGLGTGLAAWGQPFRAGSGQSSVGFGLGSSLVKSIVEAHGGRVTVTNAVPRGLVVELRFPQASA